jgi:hypothetical protein
MTHSKELTALAQGSRFLHAFLFFSYFGTGKCEQYFESTCVPLLTGCGFSFVRGKRRMQTGSLTFTPVPHVTEHCENEFDFRV